MTAKTFAVWIAGLISLALVTPATGVANTDRYSEIEATILEAAHGDLSQRGTMTVYGANGPVTTVITGVEFLTNAKTLIGGKGIKSVPGGPPSYVCVGGKYFGVIGQWPFCDTCSLFQFRYGSSAFLRAERADIDVAPRPICGGSFGATHTWREVEMDISGGCNAGGPLVLPQADIPVGDNGGYICGGTRGEAQGNGVVYSEQFFGYQFDYFLGVDDVTEIS